MNTNKPSTGEIVRALRCSADDDSFCKKCQYGYALAHAFLCDHGRMNGNAADRLESQERDIETLRAFHERYAEQTSKKYVEEICALTARAEQAEKERDAAVADLDALKDSGFCNSCVGCNAPHSESITYCTDWKRRGLPQDGGGK